MSRWGRRLATSQEGVVDEPDETVAGVGLDAQDRQLGDREIPLGVCGGNIRSEVGEKRWNFSETYGLVCLKLWGRKPNVIFRKRNCEF